MKFEYNAGMEIWYENSLENFDINHCRINVKVTVGLQISSAS